MHEDLGGGVGVDGVRAHERDHGALGQALDRMHEIGFHRLLERPADAQDLIVLAGVNERLLGLGHGLVQEHDDQLSVDRGPGFRRPPAGLL